MWQTHLDIQEQPDVFQTGSGQVAQEVFQSRHGLRWVFDGLQCTQVAPITIDDLLWPSETSFERSVLVLE